MISWIIMYFLMATSLSLVLSITINCIVDYEKNKDK